MKSYLRLSFLFIYALVPLMMGATSPDITGGGCGSKSSSPIPDVLLTSIAITPTSSEMNVAHSQQFTAIGSYEDNTTADLTSSVTWTSSNADVVSISNTGLATAVAAGSISVTATLNSITSNSASFTVNPAIFTVAGRDFTGAFPPLLIESINGGETWVLQSITDLPVSGFFYGTSCTGSGSNAICVAAGQDLTGAQPPLLVESINGGETWALQSITDLPVSGFFYGTSCTGSGSNAICVAAGQDLTGAQPPLLVESVDGGQSWVLQSVTGLPATGVFHRTSCTGSGSNAICVAAGQDLTGAQPPLLVESVNGGESWVLQSITGLPASGVFYGTSCTGSGDTAICTAVGIDNGTNGPILVVSRNGGDTWSLVNLFLTDTGVLNATQCTGSGSAALCIAVGTDYDTGLPLLFKSIDGGNTWSSVSFSIDYGELYGVSCTGSGSTAVCVGVGQGFSTLSPLIVESSDGGNTWSLVDLSLTDNGIFNGVQCTGNGSTALCVAAGADYFTGSALLYMSRDGGETWGSQSVTGLPTQSNLRATGSTK